MEVGLVVGNDSEWRFREFCKGEEKKPIGASWTQVMLGEHSAVDELLELKEYYCLQLQNIAGLEMLNSRHAQLAKTCAVTV
jgi:hypothetical protein